ncbi:MAG: methionine--tRNA ligase [Treponema sp.]|nr:methionine--tRNA ligase [Treponema sp.]
MNRRLITSALPYVNNIPHLGNLLQVLSADVFARFCRSRGYDTLYICGTDEYGTATETRALEEKISPRELCDYYHAIHKNIYEWFGIDFDYFGRTSTPQQTEIVQNIFKDLDAKGYIKENTIEQLFCSDCDRFLADRYVLGTCPHCGYEDARGDQCEHCGKLLEPTELKNPRCSTCSHTPKVKSTKHLYIDLPAIQDEYTPWMEKTSVEGQWSKNAIQMTQAWIRDGLQQRAITRDLKWGIPVPKEGFEDKVFYVWFDAPIGYISITKELSDKLANDSEATEKLDWKAWWLPSEATDTKTASKPVNLFQFIGKDNIPFHTVIFPSTLIGSGRQWTKLYHMSSTEYLNYEDGKFSKSKGIGVFGNDAKESGIPADAWRFYIFYNRPEKADTQFTWKDFQEKINSELIGNLGNLVNRTTTFVSRYYDGVIPEGKPNDELWKKVISYETKITEYFEWANLKDAFHEIFVISSIANKAFQDGEPWKTRNTDPEKAASLIRDLCYVIKDLMIMVHPFMPQYATKVLSFFGKQTVNKRVGFVGNINPLNWSNLGVTEGLETVTNAEIVFKPLDDTLTKSYREKYAGSQTERKAEKKENKINKKTQKKDIKESKKVETKLLTAEEQIEIFNSKINLIVAKIVSVEKHPEADKLYIEHLDDGSGKDRIILSGLVPYLTEDELLGKNVIIVDNLKPRKMRGIESHGMLLAADYKDADGNDRVEILNCPWAKPGTSVVLEGTNTNTIKETEIDADTFFSINIKVVNKVVKIAGNSLIANGKEIIMTQTENGEVS